MKTKIKECYNLVLSYIVPFEKMEFEIEELLKINWVNLKNQTKWFFDRTAFINHLSDNIDPVIFQGLNNLEIKDQIDFYKMCCTFIGKILKLFPHYFSFKLDILDSTSFLELNASYSDTKEKLVKFGKRFNILDEKNMPQLHEEIIKLKSNPRIQEFKQIVQNNTLRLWDLIGNQDIPLIYMLARMAQSLPTSSASIEQAFSIMKLLKTDKRNQLSNDTFEALILVNQEFKTKGEITINEEMEKALSDLKKKPQLQILYFITVLRPKVIWFF